MDSSEECSAGVNTYFDDMMVVWHKSRWGWCWHRDYKTGLMVGERSHRENLFHIQHGGGTHGGAMFECENCRVCAEILFIAGIAHYDASAPTLTARTTPTRIGDPHRTLSNADVESASL